MLEVWKPIDGYENEYEISSYGRIKALPRYVKVCGGSMRYIPEHFVKPMKCKNGYLEASLYRNRKRKVVLLHRLVANHFIENPNNYPEVNHKDENISNCRVDNLEWCTSKYNANYGTRNRRCKEAKRKYEKRVNQYNKDGTLIKTWDCIMDASRTLNADVSSIIRVCKGKQHTCVGYRWEYAK